MHSNNTSKKEERAGARQVAGAVVAAVTFLSTNLAEAGCPGWIIEVICPDLYPGPPDCYHCHLYGSTTVYEDAADMSWWGWETPFGYVGWFDVGQGVNLFSDHYNCEWSPMDWSVEAHVQVVSIDCLDVRVDWYHITCHGDNW